MNVAIIPARGGSKRIENKNIRLFRGRPIIEYSIEAALSTNLFDHVIVSTDSDEIAHVAQAAGASVPFRRPVNLSDDFTPTIPVIRHAIDWVTENWAAVDVACCIYATAPLIEVADLVEGYNKLRAHPEAEFAFSVTPFSFNIFRSLRIEDGRCSMFWPEHELTRSQDLPEAYHDAGQFYWGRSSSFQAHDGVFSAVSLPVVLPNWRVQDIDTLDDWERAEKIAEIKTETQRDRSLEHNSALNHSR